MTKRFKPGTFKGSFYSRGGFTKDKYGNTSYKPMTFRDNHTGLVLSQRGSILGVEKNRQHHYGGDPKRGITPHQTARKRAIMASLRRSGKIR